jgi:hypothetical protein
MTAASAAAASTAMPAAARRTTVPAASSATSASMAAATTVTRGELDTRALSVFLIEDVKGRQTDVGDFLLGQNKSPCVIL